MSGLPDLAAVRKLDDADPLKTLRNRFRLPETLIYLDGNSLGALPIASAQSVLEAIERQWGNNLIGGWTKDDWIGASRRVGSMIAPLIGAQAHEVVVADSTSVNLFKLIVAALQARTGRSTVLTEPGNFPTDVYIAGGVTRLGQGHHLHKVPADEIVESIDEDVAVVVLTHVHYRTGRKLDMAAITAAAHAKGALIIWDLCHSAGAIEVDLHACDADLAVGCGYKYLNGGPGAPAFLFVAERLHATLQSPLTGWMGHQAPFDFSDDYVPARGIDRFLCGTPPILGIAALEQGVATFDQVNMKSLAAKSESLFSLLLEWVEASCGEHGFELITPRDASTRGSHISFNHEHAFPICQALIARCVVGDFRAPNTLRLGLTPLYTRFEDVWRAVVTLEEIMSERKWDKDEYRKRGRVT
jgi:kynureninase